MKTSVRFLIGLLALTVLAVFATSKLMAQDPVKVGAHVYKKLFENERVRMLEVTFQPGDTIAMHSHPDHIAYVVSGGKLSVWEKGGKPQEVELKAGSPLWFNAVTHAAKNVGTTPVKLAVVELKEKPMMKGKK